jgi:hypothetical protein
MNNNLNLDNLIRIWMEACFNKATRMKVESTQKETKQADSKTTAKPKPKMRHMR